MGRLFNSIRIRITLALLVVVLSGVFAFEYFEYSREKMQVISELSDLAEKKVHRLSETLELPLWEIDNRWTSEVIANEITDRVVYAIIVYADGELFEGKKRDAQWRPVSAMDDIEGDYISISRDVLHEDEVIGRVTIYVTPQFALAELNEGTIIELSVALLLGISGLLLLVQMLNKLVIAPIERMQKSTMAIAAGDYSADIKVGREDEIGELAKSINIMKFKIQQRESERDEALLSVRKSEARIRSLVENIHTAVVVHDGEMRVTTCNPLAQLLFGLKRDQMVGKTVADIDWCFVDKDGQEMGISDHPVNRVISNGVAVRSLMVGIRKPEKRETVWLLVNAEPVRGDHGEIASVIVSYADISALKAAENALVESEKRIRSFVDNAANAFFLIDMEGRFVDVNRLACERLGYSRDELLTMKVPDIELALSIEKLMALFASMQQGDMKTITGEHQRKDGSIFPVEVRIAMIEQLGQRLVLAYARDVSDRKQAEERVQRFSQAMEQSGEAIMITDSEGTIVHINPAFTEITGYSEEEALGQNPRILKSDKQDARFFKEMWQSLRDGRAWQGKVVNRKKSGDLYPAMLTISPIRDMAGEITHYVGLQQNLERFEELEAQLHQAQKMEAIGTLVGGIAHDFNNALAGITGNLYLAKRKAAELPEVVARLNSVEKLAFRAAATIQQLLAFSRKGIVNMVPVSLVPFMKEIVKLQRVSIPENILLLLEVEDADLFVKGDVNQLQQMLMNLVNNANDAVAEAENPSITISLARYTPDPLFLHANPKLTANEYACIKVEDNGMGIPREDFAKIFEPFYTTKAVGKGSGLGLSMVYGTVKSHGGVVDVESEPGVGTSFKIYLPLMEGEALFKISSENGEVFEGHGETILIADDNDTVLESGRDVLAGLGYKVLTAEDGLQAVEQYRSHAEEIALVLLDVVMPGMGGIEAMKEIRGINPDVRVLFATGYDKLSSVADKEAIMSEAVISKPFAVSKLSQMIHEQLEKSSN
ncbi:PAS domain S-box-containing protein [Mariprofundus ferrinatatus]|uniref:histidine kinase n=1 Tax=Mariprofundus ferrinatatus TaxID=1921087 RepID=A0A2K8L8B9_9PROT|nr:PAS domain S-box protein [Mariprofundus ferrinatatus]ATX82111.1 PAS domain S-box-containing protein [Mariprofundus ferrinatatus]